MPQMRKLVIGGASYLWRVSHRHHSVGPERACQELFTAYLARHPRAPLRVQFTEGAAHGAEHIRRAGLVQEYRPGLPTWNLNRPATARALIEHALAHGWTPASAAGPLEIADGWAFVHGLPDPPAV